MGPDVVVISRGLWEGAGRSAPINAGIWRRSTISCSPPPTSETWLVPGCACGPLSWFPLTSPAWSCRRSRGTMRVVPGRRGSPSALPPRPALGARVLLSATRGPDAFPDPSDEEQLPQPHVFARVGPVPRPETRGDYTSAGRLHRTRSVPPTRPPRRHRQAHMSPQRGRPPSVPSKRSLGGHPAQPEAFSSPGTTDVSTPTGGTPITDVVPASARWYSDTSQSVTHG